MRWEAVALGKACMAVNGVCQFTLRVPRGRGGEEGGVAGDDW